jgi:hypothetical protein
MACENLYFVKTKGLFPNFFPTVEKDTMINGPNTDLDISLIPDD